MRLLKPLSEPRSASRGADDAAGRETERDLRNTLADVRDGLTREERVVLWVLHETQREFGGRNVPTATLYGRVVEHVNISVAEFQAVLQRLVGKG